MPCRTCPWLPENANRVYPLWGEIPTTGAQMEDRWQGPHTCHASLDKDGNETLSSWRCEMTPEHVIARDPDPDHSSIRERT